MAQKTDAGQLTRSLILEPRTWYDLETARKALIFSFGSEVLERLPYAFLRKKVESHIKGLLEPALNRSPH
ncbi:hypothetical protein HHK36_033320 [Tetracentron sinense]|uniref:Uncharacterized protein n=1 Tax=Tetracentron sinense TaxID=13715 RepID=A0A835CWW2_TETSI|nr:hypothetical protein HHK36_033320 [Tetracentron sinense]